MEQSLLVEEQSGILRLTINRPAERNALNRALTAALTAELRRAADNPAVRVVLLQGAGTSAFCAGADLRELASLTTPEERRAFFGGIAALIAAFTSCPKPIISKVQGYALAGGCGLVASSDLVIASPDALFGLPEIKVGIAPLMILAPLSRCIGHKALADLVLTGEPISAERALAIGLISRIDAADTIDATAEALATKIATLSPSAVTTAKKTLWSAPDQELLTSLETLADRVALLASSENAQEGITAFLEKRKPVWKP